MSWPHIPSPPMLAKIAARNIEWELDTQGKRTGRWRRRQYYAQPGVLADTRPPGQRTPCEWREGHP